MGTAPTNAAVAAGIAPYRPQHAQDSAHVDSRTRSQHPACRPVAKPWAEKAVYFLSLLFVLPGTGENCCCKKSMKTCKRTGTCRPYA